VVSVASSEGFPNTLLEVMACRTPVLAGDIPQVRELLRDGVNARICALDVPGIEAGMLEMLADPATSGRLAAAGRDTALEFGDINRNGARWAEELRAVAAAGRTQGLLSAMTYRVVLRLYQLGRWLRITSD
jgi:glycosyltransferase involved in cell wall biosynthesis